MVEPSPLENLVGRLVAMQEAQAAVLQQQTQAFVAVAQVATEGRGAVKELLRDRSADRPNPPPPRHRSASKE